LDGAHEIVGEIGWIQPFRTFSEINGHAAE
jgi:hypothetical protein